MADSRYNTLLIIEGESCEKAYFDKFIKTIKADKNIIIIPFCNDIYELYKHIKELGETTTIDVILNYCNLDDETRKLLKNTKFVYTYLVFDLDIQDGKESDRQEKLSQISKMLDLFNNETEYGKLFINYPMMESYRHFDITNPSTLNNKCVIVDNEVLTNYKKLVGQEGTNKNLSKYTSRDFYNITLAHLMQANLLVNGQFKKPNNIDYVDLIDISIINKKQKDLILKSKKMLILNTSTFLYSEFYDTILKAKN